MSVDAYERFWMWAAGGLIAVFVGAIVEIVGTNANAMVVPGYVSQFTVTFEKAGEYTIVCNEYCGVGTT